MSDHEYDINFSNAAFKDLIDIQTYTSSTFGEIQREIYQQKLDIGFRSIGSMPTIGHVHPLLSPSLRIFNIEKHMVIYAIDEARRSVNILRIVHQKINLSSV